MNTKNEKQSEHASVRILLVEDDKVQSHLMSSFMKNMGYVVQSTSMGSEAISVVKNRGADIMLLDLHLQDMHGLDVLHAIEPFMSDQELGILVISGDDDKDTIIKALSSGASDYVQKTQGHLIMSVRLSNIINNVVLKKQLRAARDRSVQERNMLSKFFPNSIINGILDQSIQSNVGGAVKRATVLICDLRNSTALSESVEPHFFAAFLTDFFSEINNIFVSEGGTVCSFRGDGFLVSYGVPSEHSEPEAACVRTALKVREHLIKYNKNRPNFLKDDLEMGIGITTGDVFSGTIGSVHGYSYTVIGDVVNLAGRLESLNKKLKTDILIDTETAKGLPSPELLSEKFNVQIRGKDDSVEIYALAKTKVAAKESPEEP